MSGDMNEDEVDEDEEDVEWPESGEWLPSVTDDKFGILLQDIPFPIMEFPPFCWVCCAAMLPLEKRAFTKDGGEGLGGLTTFVQLTRSASSGPTMSLKSSKDSSVNGSEDGWKRYRIKNKLKSLYKIEGEIYSWYQ